MTTDTVTSFAATILLNREDENGRLAIFNRHGKEPRYLPGDKLESVWSGTIDADTLDEALAIAYGMFNRGAPRFVGDDAYPQRSLSVGDVVEIDGRRFVCEPVGWRHVA